jgi:hypothetical protein
MRLPIVLDDQAGAVIELPERVLVAPSANAA